jgi:hypothetical protein
MGVMFVRNDEPLLLTGRFLVLKGPNPIAVG